MKPQKWEPLGAVRGPLDAEPAVADGTRAPLVRAAFAHVPRYEGAAVDGQGTACAIDLSDNTNRFGVPPAARRALRSTGLDGLARYPSAYGDALKRALAARAGVAPACIVTGCGSDDVLDAAWRALGGPGARLAYPEPTFSMVPVFARTNGLEPCAVAGRADGAVDVAGLLATGAQVIYLCSPNNPTGTLVAGESIDAVLAGARGLVVVDQAYVEFAGGDVLGLASRAAGADALLVTRTLSKAFGLAGLRIGYGIASPPLVREIEKARGPFKISAPAERAAVAALTHDGAWVEERVARAIRARTRLRRDLERLGFAPLPSAANFLLVPVPDAGTAAAALARAGIAVRAFTGLAGIGDALRITVGHPREMAAVVRALAEGRP